MAGAVEALKAYLDVYANDKDAWEQLGEMYLEVGARWGVVVRWGASVRWELAHPSKLWGLWDSGGTSNAPSARVAHERCLCRGGAAATTRLLPTAGRCRAWRWAGGVLGSRVQAPPTSLMLPLHGRRAGLHPWGARGRCPAVSQHPMPRIPTSCPAGCNNQGPAGLHWRLPTMQLLMYRQALFCYEELLMFMPANVTYLVRWVVRQLVRALVPPAVAAGAGAAFRLRCGRLCMLARVGQIQTWQAQAT